MELNTSREFLTNNDKIYLPAFSKRRFGHHFRDLSFNQEFVGIVVNIDDSLYVINRNFPADFPKYMDSPDIENLLFTNGAVMNVSEFITPNLEKMEFHNRKLFLDALIKLWCDKYGNIREYIKLERKERAIILKNISSLHILRKC